MKNILLILLLLFIGNSGFCDYSFSTVQYSPNPFYYQNYPQSFQKSRQYYSPRAFNNLEKRILNHNFFSEPQSQRLNRMEEATFGAMQSGDITTRYRALQKALSKKSNSSYYTPNHNALKRNVFRSFSGMPTGFTPPVKNYDDYSFPSESNYSFQSGMKFKIIDD